MSTRKKAGIQGDNFLKVSKVGLALAWAWHWHYKNNGKPAAVLALATAETSPCLEVMMLSRSDRAAKRTLDIYK